MHDTCNVQLHASTYGVTNRVAAHAYDLEDYSDIHTTQLRKMTLVYAQCCKTLISHKQQLTPC